MRSSICPFFAAFAIVFLVGSHGAAQTGNFAMESIRNLSYYDGDEADAVRHKLDIHRPKDCQDYPVLFFVHGGGWVEGNKDHFGIYSVIARTLARQGVGMVCPNYRLSPQVKHPEHIRDVAKAFAWTSRNIGKYGGNPRALFVGGHSAGGHLSALLATDERYLKAEGLGLSSIRGAMPVSGVFNVPNLTLFDSVFGKDSAGAQAWARRRFPMHAAMCLLFDLLCGTTTFLTATDPALRRSARHSRTSRARPAPARSLRVITCPSS